jgi:microcystin degradation protein MlrC
LSVSFGHGFPYGDVADNGAKVWVIADRDAALAQRLATQLGHEIIAMRAQTHMPAQPLDGVLDRMLEIAIAQATPPKPVVIADRADNAGGGAASDSTFVLRRLIERGIGNVALGAFFDLGAVQACREVGEGATTLLRVGGKIGPLSGDPVDLRVQVMRIAPEHAQTTFAGGRTPCGPSVWVRTETGLDLVLISVRQQVIGTDLFTGLGIDLGSRQAVVVKSSQHFHAAFAPIAAAVLYADTPGLLRSDMENIPFVKRDKHYWPRVADPWGTHPTGQ